MSHVFALGNFDWHFESLNGFSVTGEDGESIGSIQNAIVDHHSGEVVFLVLETGFGRQVLVPFSHFRVSSKKEPKLQADITREITNRLPVFDERFLLPGAWEDYRKLYQGVVEELFGAGDDRSDNITSIDQHRSRNILEQFADNVRRHTIVIRHDCRFCAAREERAA